MLAQSMAPVAGHHLHGDGYQHAYLPNAQRAATWVQKLPVQRSYSRSVGSSSGGLSYAQHEFLRQRKTPHGKEVDTLDIASFDDSSRPPASKHLLLSLPAANVNATSPGRGGNTYSRRTENPSSYFSNRFGEAHGMVPPLNEPAWVFPGGYDTNTPHGLSSPRSHSYTYNMRSQVPTVMPYNLQPTFVPTASAAQQYYGPYWPDGTFSPYRPTPVRDDRFFHWRHSRNLSQHDGRDTVDQMPLPFDASPSPYDNPSYDATQGIVQGVQMVQSLPARDGFVSYASFQDRMANASGGRAYPGQDITQTNFPISAKSHPAQATSASYSHGPLQTTPLSDLLTEREAKLSWAYRAYIDLLTEIHRNAKSTNISGTDGKNRYTPKPAIFPKPPQRSASTFSGSLELEQERLIGLRQSKPNMSGGVNQYSSSRPSTAIRSPLTSSEHAPVPPADREHRRPVYEAARTVHDRLMYTAFSTKDDNFLPTPHEAYRKADEPTSNAMSALDQLEHLCYGSDNEWTDGMLLAGCLAYGIGHYTRALAWYQKVLKCDSGHVEAMSNLAATLLALGRNEEAIEHWSDAIKLRPAYFEAVEHLVGLFVSSQRTKNAVDIIEYVESRLKLTSVNGNEPCSEDDSDSRSYASSATVSSVEGPLYDYELTRKFSRSSGASEVLRGFGSCGYAIPAADTGRLLALIHAKGNMLYALGNSAGAASTFESAILLATGGGHMGIQSLISRILQCCVSSVDPFAAAALTKSKTPILLSPDRAQQIRYRMFPPTGDLPGLSCVPTKIASRAGVATTSNALLSLAKIYQDGLSNQSLKTKSSSAGTREILALYYLSLSLLPSPSTANNVGILLASVQNASTVQIVPQYVNNRVLNYCGVTPGTGVALALAYYQYGLNLDGKHAHLYTNLGSLLKDLGDLPAAIKMYETAVSCDGSFDIALANLANAVKDQGRIVDAIGYYKRAVKANPDFAEAVCGLATALNSICDWKGRGGVFANYGTRDRYHVDEQGMLQRAHRSFGWMNRVVDIVDKQLRDGENWGSGVLTAETIGAVCHQLTAISSDLPHSRQKELFLKIQRTLQSWTGRRWEGSRLVRLLERATKQIGWQWYQDRYVMGKEYSARRYARPSLPAGLYVPTAPTVLPFHTFTTPLSAKQVRQISQRNALRISVSTMKSTWLPNCVYPPPAPPQPYLRVGYVSSDFNNHPLAHLMQSIFGLHDPTSVRAYCYATTASDGSIHRAQIEREAPVFHNAASWTVERLVNQIVEDGIHILVNLNGYTRGARNEVFAARPAPIHMSFMGFAGTLGAEWCDYVYADEISVPKTTLAPWRHNFSISDRLDHQSKNEDEDDWVYAENIIYSRSTFFCVDHKQSAPDASIAPPTFRDTTAMENAWQAEQSRRWTLRKQLFPQLNDDAIILGNFNQLYKIDPSTFRMYLRILAHVPNAILWLLKFPDAGEENLLAFARLWADPDVASRVIFTDVAPKGTHITRASVVDLFLDTPECNAHTTAADVIWSGTPIVTWARWDYKMCSRMASSIVASALPQGVVGDKARKDLLVSSEQEYENHAIRLANDLRYPLHEDGVLGHGTGRLMELRRILWEGRWNSRLFDTRRWVRDLEKAYWAAWTNWVDGKGGDIFM